MSNLIRAARSPNDILAVLDIGTAKIACLIAARGNEAPHSAAPTREAILSGPLPVRVLGVGYQRAQGVKAGTIVDLAAAEQAIRGAIAEAEHTAGLQIEQVVVATACGRLKSLNFQARAALGALPINDADIARVMAAGQSYAERDGRKLVHLNRIAWRLDGQGGIHEPRGMRGGSIEADLHAITADAQALRNLLIAVERADVKPVGFVAAPFASGLSTSTDEERRYGVTVIDIGAGVSTLAYFGDGHLLHVEALAVGGDQITYDIARALTIPLAQAERIKTLYGTLLTAPSDEHALVDFPQASEEGAAQRLTRGRLARIVQPRAEELLQLLRARLDGGPFAAFAAGHVVLTGGTSQFAGAREFAANVLRRPVRIGRPRALTGLRNGHDVPPFAVGVGLIEALFVPGACVLTGTDSTAMGAPQGYLGQVGSWLRRSF